jgi:hypothetical protein
MIGNDRNVNEHAELSTRKQNPGKAILQILSSLCPTS